MLRCLACLQLAPSISLEMWQPLLRQGLFFVHLLWYNTPMDLSPVDFKAVAANGCFVYAYLRHSDSKTGKALSPYYVGIAVSDKSGQRYRRPFGKHESAPVPTDKRFVRVMRSGLTEEQACAWERFYIFWFGRETEGGILLNRSEGGDLNQGWKHSDNWKSYMSEIMQQRVFTQTHRANLSASYSPSRCAKIWKTRRVNGTDKIARTAESIAKQKATNSKKPRESFRTPEMVAKTKEAKLRKSAAQLGITFAEYASLTEKQARAIKARFKRGKRGADLVAGLVAA